MSEEPKKKQRRRPHTAADPELVSAKATLQLRVLHLQEKLARSKEKNDTLGKEVEKLRSALDSERGDTHDVLTFLKKQLADSMRENTEYERKYAAKEDECDLLKAHLETSFQAERAKFGDMEKRYMQQINKLKAELDDLVDFKNAKQDHEHELEEARNARELERKSYKDTLYEMEREGARERERLRKEKDEEIGLIKQTLLRLTQRKLDTSTKMTMVENDQVARELKQQAKQTLNLLNESKQLKDEVQQLRQKLDIMTGLQDEMAHKTQVQHSLIKTLLAKLKKEQRRTADAEARASSAPVSAGAATQGSRRHLFRRACFYCIFDLNS
eukprot:TRINITY_DN605_c0_g1_i4.p1 TRINITY_DN605_c0_g1~~TRINITY_DN605_c0_g1_i4.p1  ORF type:complete len:328 (+),score=110.68 TRINITY_DN605_c0_g1_i4:21-1004(+)